ncbi:MAG: universal stress protein [Rhodopirellula sp.]|nr:universal stress protein [Rhodopirellula sp.]
MDHFQNILVGVDLCDGDSLIDIKLSASTRAAIDKALWLAARTSAKVTFLSSLMPCLDLTSDARNLVEMQQYQGLIDCLHDKACERMTGLVEEARSAGIEAREIRTGGKPWYELIREVVQEKFDLVLVGSHQRHTLGHLLLGSTGRRLIRKCPCPVWVTAPGEPGTVRSILAPTDFSETAASAVKLAHSLAQQFEAQLHVLHVVESHFEPAMRHLIEPVAEVEDHFSREQADAQRDLNNALAQAGLDDAINLEHRHIAAGPPHLMIQEAVKKFSTDLIVMGTQARHGIPGLLIGNTAERVFSHLTCSVLAVKPDAFQCPIEFPEP